MHFDQETNALHTVCRSRSYFLLFSFFTVKKWNVNHQKWYLQSILWQSITSIFYITIPLNQTSACAALFPIPIHPDQPWLNLNLNDPIYAIKHAPGMFQKGASSCSVHMARTSLVSHSKFIKNFTGELLSTWLIRMLGFYKYTLFRCAVSICYKSAEDFKHGPNAQILNLE